VSCIGVKDQSPLRCRQRRRFFIGKRALHRGRRNLVNLISVNKSQTVMGLYGDAVEQVLFGNLQDVFNPAELVASRAKNRRANF